LRERGYDPLDYRYFCLGGHYRSQLVFSWQSLDAARSARRRLVNQVVALKEQVHNLPTKLSSAAQQYVETFVSHLNNDLNTPRGLALLWTLLKDEALSGGEKLAVIYEADKILALSLKESEAEQVVIPSEVQALIDQRSQAKAAKDYAKADELRAIVQELGYSLKDTVDGTIVTKTCNQNGR
ncbi:MAG: cysteine--tRNA ligase, partial [Sphaerochaetaceae bacterium]